MSDEDSGTGRPPGALTFREQYLANEQEYRHQIGWKAIETARRGQVFAFTLSICFLGAGTASILRGHDAAGAAVAASASVTLAVAFLGGAKVSRRSGGTTDSDALPEWRPPRRTDTDVIGVAPDDL
jgi:hypothetical protein